MKIENGWLLLTVVFPCSSSDGCSYPLSLSQIFGLLRAITKKVVVVDTTTNLTKIVLSEIHDVGLYMCMCVVMFYTTHIHT